MTVPSNNLRPNKTPRPAGREQAFPEHLEASLRPSLLLLYVGSCYQGHFLGQLQLSYPLPLHFALCGFVLYWGFDCLHVLVAFHRQFEHWVQSSSGVKLSLPAFAAPGTLIWGLKSGAIQQYALLRSCCLALALRWQGNHAAVCTHMGTHGLVIPFCSSSR